MRAVLLCALVAISVALGFVACNPNSIGRPCVNPGGQAVAGAQVSSPALECPSRLCLLEPPSASSGMSGGADGGARQTCTADCQDNSDCDAETKAQCASGFVCAVAVTTGPFCCRKLCVCKDDLEEGKNSQDGGAITPAACAPATSACANVVKKK